VTQERLTLQVKEWSTLHKVTIAIPQSTLSISKGTDDEPSVLLRIDGLSDDQAKLLCPDTTTTVATSNNNTDHRSIVLNMACGQKAQKTVRVFNSFFAAPILKFVAGQGLGYDLSPTADWLPLTSIQPGDVPFGRCTQTVPHRPAESWVWNIERSVFERTTEPGESRKYYLALQSAPRAFQVCLDPTATVDRRRSLKIHYHPEVVAHHAASNLIRGRGATEQESNLTIGYKLSDVSQQPDPVLRPFVVRACHDEVQTVALLKPPYQLYARQAKVLTRMVAIENGERHFDEIELCDMSLPGSVGLSLIAKAERTDTRLRGGVIADAIGAGKTVVSIAIILQGIERARLAKSSTRQSNATLVVLPPALVDQWESEIKKFTSELSVLKIYDFHTLKTTTVADILQSDVVIAPIDILESDGYLPNLFRWSKLEQFRGDNHHDNATPSLPTYCSQKEYNNARGVWIPATSQDPYGGGNNPLSQRRRDQTAYYTVAYQEAIVALRANEHLAVTTKGVPLEYFEWERIIVDEIHECLCTTKSELDDAKETSSDAASSGFFKEKNRRAGRELLGITQRDTAQRPLLCRRGTFGLTGTPLLDNSNRVTELAHLMGGVYVTGLSGHWRKLERESCRDIFLHNYLEPKQSREYRQTVYGQCQEYLYVACCRNKVGDDEMAGVRLQEVIRTVTMSHEEVEQYLASQSGIPLDKRSLAIKPEDFDQAAGHDISKWLRQNARLACRGKALVDICTEILSGDPTTKIIVFTDGKIGGGQAAREALIRSGLGCTWLAADDSVQTQNQKIAGYQTADATVADRGRPRVLVLHFDHAAGLNLQTECAHLILFSPLYVGMGGTHTDAVVDASTELQAIGRVYRPGQTQPTVHVYRVAVTGPDGEECLDGQLLRRNTDESTLQQAVNGH
jgi:SNF2-related domain